MRGTAWRRRRRRWCPRARTDRSAIVASDLVAGLARAEHTQHSNVAGGLVAPGVREDLVERAITTLARQFAHAWMLADRVEARMLAQPVDRCPDRDEPAL